MSEFVSTVNDMHYNRSGSKRKLDDDITYSETVAPSPLGMRTDQSLPSTSGSTRLQFFVRPLYGKTLSIQAHSTDSVESIHSRIHSITGIPAAEQRLIYLGRQLQRDQTLSSDCNIENDATLQLLGRMRSTAHPKAWELVNKLRSQILLSWESNHPTACDGILEMLIRFVTMIVELTQITMCSFDDQDIMKKVEEVVVEYFNIFTSSSIPAALVTLYMSPFILNKIAADNSIRQFISACENDLPKHIYKLCCPVILEFCTLLRRAAGADDDLYRFCRDRLAAMLKSVEEASSCASKASKLEVFFPFINELAAGLSHELGLCASSPTKLTLNYVHEFAVFMQTVRQEIWYHCSPLASPLQKEGERFRILQYREQIEHLYRIFCDLLEKMDTCLVKLERQLGLRNKPTAFWLCKYLLVLKELHAISKLYEGLESIFLQKMMEKKASLCFLIVRFAQRPEDCLWVFELREITTFEVRRHLALMMLPKVRDDDDDLHEMLIDRAQLLEESFEYIGQADPALLRRSLFVEFKDEEATGPGVMREWFFLVCQEIFNPQNALFVACPNDQRRFLPNPASKVNLLHLEYFIFAGRMIALALMHKVQIGITFDRVFFLQLAGNEISLEDIRDTDPYLYRGCKKILEMDSGLVDEDVLGLTFVSEVQETGSTKVVELWPNGKNTVVNSKNRSVYVNLLIQHRFVSLISPQIACFARGFADVINSSELQKLFFQSLDLQDLDWMLVGSENDVSVEDWKAHTDYHGYTKNDPQISWFWKIVGRMSGERRRMLLFFWTSIQSLPVDGFAGLSSKLYIYRSADSCNHLPYAHTCFYRLCIPPYKSMGTMQKQLGIITREHVGCSFGIS